MKKIIRNMLTFIFLTAIFYPTINVIVTYFTLFAKFSKLHGKASAGFWRFNSDYLFTTPDKFKVIQIAMLSLMISIFLFNKIRKIDKIKSHENVEGSAHWMPFKEIKEILYMIPENSMCNAIQSGIILYQTKQNEKTKKHLEFSLFGYDIQIHLWWRENVFFIDKETIHSLIIGTTRSGKGQTVVLHMLRMLCSTKIKQNLIINDPKGELLENIYELLIENKYVVKVLNLRDTNYSDQWNPLTIIIEEFLRAMEMDCPDFSKLTKLVGNLSGMLTYDPKSDPIWPQSAKSLLSAIILLMLDVGYINKTLDKLNMYSVYSFFVEYGDPKNNVTIKNGDKAIEMNALDYMFKNLPAGSPAKLAYATSNFASGDMRGSIFAILANNLYLFGADSGISSMTSGNDFDFNQLDGTGAPCAIFMVLPDQDPSRNIIASLFVEQCYSQLVSFTETLEGQKLTRRTQFILDEFGNMPAIPDMDTKITISLGRNILFNLFIQDLNQLDSRYGNTSQTIRSNCGNLIYINSMDKVTNEYFSSLLGNETIEYTTYSGNIDDWMLSNESQVVRAKPLMSADELSVLPFGSAIIKRQRCYPIRTKFIEFYKLGIPIKPIKEITADKYRQTNIAQCLFPLEVFTKLFPIPPEVTDTQKMTIIIGKLNKATGGAFKINFAKQDFVKCTMYINMLKTTGGISKQDAEFMLEVMRSGNVSA